MINSDFLKELLDEVSKMEDAIGWAFDNIKFDGGCIECEWNFYSGKDENEKYNTITITFGDYYDNSHGPYCVDIKSSSGFEEDEYGRTTVETYWMLESYSTAMMKVHNLINSIDNVQKEGEII